MTRLFVRLLLLTAVCALSLQADVVVLKNGDRITGTVQLDRSGSLKITTEYAGDVVIDWAHVVSLVTDEEVPLQLKTGEHIRGRLVSSDSGTVRIVSTEIGESDAIAIEQIEGVRKSKEDFTEADFWSGQLSAGFSIADGNVRTQTYYARAEAVRESEGFRLTLRGRSNYTRDQGEETGKKHFGSLKMDVFMWRDLYAYGLTSFEYDRFAGVNLRSIISAGLGYRVLKTDSQKLDFELGVAYTNEDLRRQSDDHYIALRAAVKYTWQINERLRWSNLLEFYPSVEDTKDFLVHGETSLLVEIFRNFNLEAGVIWDHDSTPPTDRQRNDTLYLLGVTYRF